MPGYEAGGIRRQENRRAGELVDASESRHRRAHQELLAASGFQELAIQIRLEHAGSDRIDRYPMPRPFHRERARESGHARLARRVGGHFVQADERRQRGDGNDAAALLLDHRGAKHLAGAQHAGQVRLEDARPIRFVHLQRRHALGHAGGGHHDVDAAQLAHARVAQRRHRRDVGHVGACDRRSASARANLDGRPLHQVATPSGSHHVRARVGEAERDGAADAARAAHDHGDTAGEIEQRLPHHTTCPRADSRPDPLTTASIAADSAPGRPGSRLTAMAPTAASPTSTMKPGP